MLDASETLGGHDDEQYVHITLWTLLASPLLLGNDLTQMDECELGLVTNDEVLAVHQDPLGKAKVGVTWGELGIKGKQRVRDLWRQQDVGVIDREFSATVPRHGTLFLKLTAQ